MLLPLSLVEVLLIGVYFSLLIEMLKVISHHILSGFWTANLWFMLYSEVLSLYYRRIPPSQQLADKRVHGVFAFPGHVNGEVTLRATLHVPLAGHA